MAKEVWRDIPEYEGYYQVSNKGRVRSLDRKIKKANGELYSVKGKVMKGYPDKDGYLRLAITKDLITKKYPIHRLVGFAFIPNPENKPQINHKDAVKDNNHVDNLEWVTNQENRDHSVANGLEPDQHGYRNPNIKLTEEDVHLVRRLWKEDKTAKRIGEIVGTTRSNVNNIVFGYTWKWLK